MITFVGDFNDQLKKWLSNKVPSIEKSKIDFLTSTFGHHQGFIR